MQRKRVSVTVDPNLLKEVDTFVIGHAGLDRSKVFDEALALWYAARQEEAMAAQFALPPEQDEAEQIADWRAIQRAAAAALLQRQR